jgi:uncharacterized protein
MLLCRVIVVLAGISLILSCSAPAPRSNQPETTPQRIEKIHAEASLSSQDYLRKAEGIDLSTGDTQKQVILRNSWLLKMAEALQNEQQCEKSIKLLRVLRANLNDSTQTNTAKLLEAECLIKINTPLATQQAIELLTGLQHAPEFSQRLAQLQVNLYTAQHAWMMAAAALLRTDMTEPQKSQQIWALLQHLDLNQLQQASLTYPALQPWLQLSIIVKRHGDNADVFKQQVVAWQQRHALHPLTLALPDEVNLALKQLPLRPQKIAVLLPLSGRLATQGQALKEGILAAYLDKRANVQPQDSSTLAAQVEPARSAEDQTLHFFDSALKTPAELNVLVADYDLILGPLLKENIAGLKTLLDPSKIMLALNRLEQTQGLAPTSISEPNDGQQRQHEHYFYALAPEDEAQQLASYIKEKGFKRPIIFSADNSVTSRMTDTFLQTWMADGTQDKTPDVAVFADSKDMREQVAGLLDVEQSQARIRQMENMADVEVFSVERNRQDIDAIVLFANPEQTELLNPIIEASLSPAAEQRLAVFASSRSYSLDLSKNSLRDLRNLTFSDMPWMLPGHAWTPLANQVSSLWPQQQDALMRLFAMGYDAYQLLPALRQLRILDNSSVQGLTGKLSMTQDGVIHRILPLAQVQQDRVALIAVD